MVKAQFKPHESATPTLRWRLKLATQGHHDRVERRLGLMESRLTRTSYRQLLESMWGFYDPLEDVLARLDWSRIDVDFAARRKTPWLEDDLLDLGHTPHSLERLSRCRTLPQASSSSQGLGILYVLEGATLGGQLISRRLAAELDLGPTCAARFFASYGSATGSMWKSYLSALEKAGAEQDAAAAIERAAIDTFCMLDAWLAASYDDERLTAVRVQPEARTS